MKQENTSVHWVIAFAEVCLIRLFFLSIFFFFFIVIPFGIHVLTGFPFLVSVLIILILTLGIVIWIIISLYKALAEWFESYENQTYDEDYD